MSTITTRAGKGSPLTHNEVDSNFTNLNNDKYQAGGALGTPASGNLANCTFPTLNQDTTGNAATVTNGVYVTDIGSTVLAYDSNLQSFLNTFSLPTTDSTAGYVLKTDGAGNLSFVANGSTFTYPSAGIANSTGSAWGTSYSTTGSGSVLALSTSPSFTTPILGTPTSGTLTNCTGYTYANLSGTVPTWNQNTTGSAATLSSPLPISNISATGTPSSTTYLRGDGSWSTVSSGGGGTVTSVSGTGTVSGISLSGTVTSSGSLTLGGTLSLASPPTIGNTTPNTGAFTSVTTPSVTATTTDLTLSAISTGAVKFSTLGGLQAQVADIGDGTRPLQLNGGSAGGVSSAGISATVGALQLSTAGNNISFYSNGRGATQQFNISHTASAVNYVQVTGAATTTPVQIQAQGSDAGIGIQLKAKGTSAISFWSGGGSYQQLRLIGSNNAVNNFAITGSASTIVPSLSSEGSDTNISMAFQPKGTGAIDLAAGSSGVNISNGGTVTAITTATRGSGYTAMPSVALSAPTTSGGVQATATALLNVNTITLVSGGTGYSVNDVLTVSGVTGGTVQVTVNTVSAGVISTFTITNFGSGQVSAIPANPVSVTGGTGSGATFTVNWNCGNITVGTAGSGYVEQPTVTITGGSVNGTAFASVGGATIVRSLASPLSLYTQNGEGFRVQNSGTASTSFWTAFGTSTTPILRAVSSVSGAIGTESAVPIQFQTNTNFEQFRVSHTASAVNYVQVNGGATGTSPTITAQGSDATIGLQFSSKSASIIFVTRSGNQRSFNILDSVSPVNYLQVQGNTTGVAPILSAQGTDTNIDIALTPKGTGGVAINSAIKLGAGASAGTAGQVLTSAGAGASPTWSAASGSGGMTLLGTLTTTSGASQSLTGLTLTSYKQLLYVFNNVNTVAAATISVGTSQTRGSSTNPVYGQSWVDLTTGYQAAIVSVAGAQTSATGYSTATTSVGISTSGTFNSGSVQVYGLS